MYTINITRIYKVANVTVYNKMERKPWWSTRIYNTFFAEWRSAPESKKKRRNTLLEQQLQTNQYMVPGITQICRKSRNVRQGCTPLSTTVTSSEKTPVGRQCPTCCFFISYTLLRNVYADNVLSCVYFEIVYVVRAARSWDPECGEFEPTSFKHYVLVARWTIPARG